VTKLCGKSYVGMGLIQSSRREKVHPLAFLLTFAGIFINIENTKFCTKVSVIGRPIETYVLKGR
jgi:hypothetical protein